jgi:abortive infection bacteriophage resistance protein
MTYIEFNEISEYYHQVKQKEKYVEICKIFSYDNSKELVKSEIISILKEKNLI